MEGWAEKGLGRPLATMREGHRDRGRDAVRYVAVLHGSDRLAEAFWLMVGLKSAAIAQAVRRFGERLASNPHMRRFAANRRRPSAMATDGH